MCRLENGKKGPGDWTDFSTDRQGLETNACWFGCWLEVDLSSDLEDTRIVCSSDIAGGGVVVGRADTRSIDYIRIYRVELRVVKRVERLRSELESRLFGESEVLVQREVPIVAANALDLVLS